MSSFYSVVFFWLLLYFCRINPQVTAVEKPQLKIIDFQSEYEDISFIFYHKKI